MREIPLTQGKVALVDNADYDWLNQHKWHANEDCSGNFYAARNLPLGNGKYYHIRMHRQILGLKRGDKREIDHKNHKTLDNRRINIRICTHQQNLMNHKLHSNTSSKYKGVYWDKQHKKWRARIYIKGKRKHLGRFEDEKQAALAYNEAAKKYYGEFAFLNKIA